VGLLHPGAVDPRAVHLLVPLDDGRADDAAVGNGDADRLEPVLVQSLEVVQDVGTLGAEIRAGGPRRLLEPHDEVQHRGGVDVL
jgi:hypothetical protein